MRLTAYCLLLTAVSERKQPPNILLGQRGTVLTAFERLGILNCAAGLLAIARDQQVAVAIGVAAHACIQLLAQPGPALLAGAAGTWSR